MKLLAFLLFSASALLAQNALLVDLSGSWRSIDEDSPTFADPAFDDSSWRTVTLPRGELIPLERQGTRPAWLRRRVQLPTGTDRSQLALTLGTPADVYEVWLNGKLLGRTGDFDSLESAHIPHPVTFDLPPTAVPATGDLLIALRIRWAFWAPPIFDMGDRGPYLITLRADAPRNAGAEQMTIWRERHSLALMFATAFLLIALACLLVWRADQDRTEFAWFALVSLVYAFNAVYHNLIITPEAQPYNRVGTAVLSAILGCSMYPLFTQFVASALGYHSLWLRLAIWAGWSVLPVVTILQRFQRTGGNLANVWVALVAIALIVHHWRRVPFTRLAVPDHLFRLILLVQAAGYLELWGRYMLGLKLLMPEWYLLGPYRLWREDLFWLPVSTVILMLMIRRITADRRERLRLASELGAARTVQQLLFAPLGEESPIEAVYEPALEVGGDFYQVFALAGGGYVVAVGDVSGKGLKAAMVVSLLAGALRNRHSDEPDALLGELNRVASLGLDGGFVTAAVARFDAGGLVTIASAGHPAPYLQGEEVALEAGLPLGIDPAAGYSSQKIFLPPGGQLTFVSDGVVEAENSQRELFGFERTRAISGKSAQEIAKAAKAWGQNDDITVVTVTRET